MKDVSFSEEEFSKASFSQYTPSVCVKVAIRGDVVGVRDSKDPNKTTLCFTVEEWSAFIQGVKAGEFDTS